MSRLRESTPAISLRTAAVTLAAAALTSAAVATPTPIPTPIPAPTPAQTPAVPAPTPLSPELARGRALYDTSCIGCHDRGVHQRESRIALNFAGVLAQVLRWNINVGTNWRSEDIAQVAAYLNARYYGFPCPPELCAPPARAERLGDPGT